jgi:adenylate kinase
MDVYRIGTLLEGVRDLATALAAQGKRVRVCVQGSMGTGVFTAMPLQLAGVRRVLDSMEWLDGDAGGNVRIGGVSAEDVAADDDIFIVIAPQNITGYSVLPYLGALCDAAGARPVLLINPRLLDIPSSNNGELGHAPVACSGRRRTGTAPAAEPARRLSCVRACVCTLCVS